MRGLYTCGVLDYFMEKDIIFPSVYGVSAGACHACSYISKQPGRAMKTAMDFRHDKRYASMFSFLTTGDFFGVDMSYNLIPNELLPFDYDTFEQNPVKFYAAVTNCDSGETEYKPVSDLRQDMDIIRASSSLPLLSRFVKIDGKKYLDGGVSDSISLLRSIDDGNTRNVVLLTQHRGYRKAPDSILPLMKIRYSKYPKLIEAISRRHVKYNETLDLIYKLESENKVLVIQPKEPVEISRLEKNREKLMALYDIGHQDAEAAHDKLALFIKADA